jgi:membrane-associated protein
VGGWLFGGYVQKNFKLVILAIIVISVLPGVYEYVRSRGDRNRAPLEPGDQAATG